MNSIFLFNITCIDYASSKTTLFDVYSNTTINNLKENIREKYNYNNIVLKIMNNKTKSLIKFDDDDLISNLFSKSDSLYVQFIFIDLFKYKRC